MKKNLSFKKLFGCGVLLAATMLTAVGCGGDGANEAADGSSFDATKSVLVVSREDGSGTRGAFVELFGVEAEAASGEKVDQTTVNAQITNNTAVMMTTVAGADYAIGYVSLGSLDDSVKALQIDGVSPTAEAIMDGSYTIARPFNIATRDGLSETAQDFISFILSSDGQAVVADNGYIALDAAEAYAAAGLSGKVVVAGSSSVTPVMEKLKEAYIALNPDVEIEIQQSDSSTGMSAVAEGICDIGMASRELKDSELANGLTPTVIAMDGIAVIVNNNNPTESLTAEQVRGIFTGELTLWSDVTAE